MIYCNRSRTDRTSIRMGWYHMVSEASGERACVTSLGQRCYQSNKSLSISGHTSSFLCLYVCIYIYIHLHLHVSLSPLSLPPSLSLSLKLHTYVSPQGRLTLFESELKVKEEELDTGTKKREQELQSKQVWFLLLEFYNCCCPCSRSFTVPICPCSMSFTTHVTSISCV
jgi:hypothetical protein